MSGGPWAVGRGAGYPSLAAAPAPVAFCPLHTAHCLLPNVPYELFINHLPVLLRPSVDSSYGTKNRTQLDYIRSHRRRPVFWWGDSRRTRWQFANRQHMDLGGRTTPMGARSWHGPSDSHDLATYLFWLLPRLDGARLQQSARFNFAFRGTRRWPRFQILTRPYSPE